MTRDLSYCRAEFPSLGRLGPNGAPLVYLDGPGGSQVPASVVAAITDYYWHRNSNTHGAFPTSQETDRVIEHARESAAALLGAADSATISFGQNMTTLNFLLSQAIAETLQPGDEIVVTELDHDANVAPWLRLASHGVVIRHVPLLPSGELDLDRFESVIGPKTRLVAVGWASNALGTVNPVEQVRRWTDRQGAWLVIDAVHWAPHGEIDVTQLQPDFLLCSAYKFFGPHVGVLYAKPGLLDSLPTLKVRPQDEHGPARIETGTLNHAALAGVSAAVDFIASLSETPADPLRLRLTSAMRAIYHYEHELAQGLYQGLSGIDGVRVWGPPVGQADRAPTVSFTLAGRTAGEVAAYLGHQGILAWDGDFYAVGAVDALGLREQGGLVRLGLAPYNTAQEVARTLDAVATLSRS